MKKIVKHTILLAIYIVIILMITACSQNQQAPDDEFLSNGSDIVPDDTLVEPNEPIHEETSDGAYANLFTSFPFNSVEELYRGLRDIDYDELQDISDIETQHMEETRSIILISDVELRDGVFGSFRNTLLREETMLLPYYQDSEMPLDYQGEGFSSIFVSPAGDFRKPVIRFRGMVDDNLIMIETFYYDRNMLDEANEKGAAWLREQLNPGVWNVHNYEQFFKDGTIIYEQEVQLGDRSVIAMVVDGTLTENPNSYSAVWFVYDDVLVSLWGWHPLEILMPVLPYFTLREVSLATGEPLRDSAGRENSRFSTITPQEDNDVEDNQHEEDFSEGDA